MSDSFEFTLHYPLSKWEDWDKLSDPELENTMYVTFQTPQGRRVRYIKCDVLDKIRAEILNFKEKCNASDYLGCGILEIIDKYMAESEEQDG